MSLAVRRIKLYTKAVVVLAVALAVGTILVKNRNNTVAVWFFGLVDPERQVNVVTLLLCTAAGSVLCWWILVRALSLVRDLREVSREKQLRAASRAQEQRARELQKQEKRIDDKIQRVIGRDADPDE